MGLVRLVSFLSGIEIRISGISGISLLFERIEIRISGISGISLLFEWNKHGMNRDRSDHQWCKEVNGKTCF